MSGLDPASAALHASSAPVFARMLGHLQSWLKLAQAHADATGLDAAQFLPMRLAPDMLPFSAQVVIACEVAKISMVRLLAVEAPTWPGQPASMADLDARLGLAIEYLQGMSPESFAGCATREVVVTSQRGGAPQHFSGQDFLLHNAVPNFYFHVTTAYALLRHAGVALGKDHFLGVG